MSVQLYDHCTARLKCEQAGKTRPAAEYPAELPCAARYSTGMTIASPSQPAVRGVRVAVQGFLAAVLTLALAMTYIVPASGKNSRKLENMLYLELKNGRAVIELYPEAAPKHVARIKELARQKFYDGIVFHRVIPGFMAQTGDPTGTGTGGSGQNLPAEFSQELSFERGTIGMARTSDPNSGDSQWFICFAPASHLNGQYTIWGKVVEGMDLVDGIATGEPPAQPDKIVSLRVAADVEGGN